MFVDWSAFMRMLNDFQGVQNSDSEILKGLGCVFLSHQCSVMSGIWAWLKRNTTADGGIVEFGFEVFPYVCSHYVK